MKQLYLSRGLPECGKTFVANSLSENNLYPVISADDYFELDGEYIFNGSKIKNAHEYSKKTTKKYLEQNISKIFVANTFTTESEMTAYFEMAKIYNYNVICLIVKNRHGNSNVHNVPNEILDKMFNRFKIKLK
jgi:predicted kinase